ncbi:MAG: NADH-quinone oxidoreductase subunit M [Caldilineaceae bacterium]|nr:NADH-quinone oxidoreductase subunit M [Caldilineaceae bacterium]
MLSTLTFLPVVGAIVVLLAPSDNLKKWLAFGATIATFVVSLLLLPGWQEIPDMQFVERYAWMPDLNIYYHLGVDGISLWLVLLTTLLMPIAVAFSNQHIKQNLGGYLALMLLMETAVLGVFLALDLVLFYVFWEFSLIPMAFLIGKWGSQNRIYAAIKFFLYTLAGSALMLVAILALYFNAGTFDLLALQEAGLPPGLQQLAFLAFALAFAIKVPLFPFHTWLPDAHVEAPTAGSVILAGVLLKLGTYGFLRFALPLFPVAVADYAALISILAVIGILYGALVALAQRDLKSLVAYSSVAHMGFVVLGIFALNEQGISGAVLQMVNHGLSTGALFLMVGMLYERRHTRLLKDYGGLWASVPIFSFFFLIVAMSSAGLPGLNGFIGEFTILLGTYKSSPLFAVLGTAGVILAAWYLLHAFRQVAQGELTNPANFKGKLPDLNWAEIGQLLPIVLLFFVIGLAPNFFLDKINPSVAALEVVQTPVVGDGRLVDSSYLPSLTADNHTWTSIY